MDSSGEWPGFPKDTSRLPRSYEQERYRMHNDPYINVIFEIE
jgi:hypothetical protein